MLEMISGAWVCFGSIVQAWWWQIVTSIAVTVWVWFFPPWRPRAKVEFLGLPCAAEREKPDKWPEFEPYDDGSRPALVRITNVGPRKITLEKVVLDYGSRRGVPLGGIVFECTGRDGRFRPFTLGVNSSCTYQASIPNDAFGKNACIKFFFQNKKFPKNLKFM